MPAPMKRLLALALLASVAGCTTCGADPNDLCASVTCTAADQCHEAGTCDPQTGACSSPVKTDGAACNDGNACTLTDSCQAGVCNGGSPKTCTAASQCQDVGTCDPMTGACSNPAKSDGTSCNDGDACTQTDSCQSGACVGASPVTCTASDQCHDLGTCDPMTGACSNPAKSDGASCSDGDACTQNDTCQSGVCGAGAPKTCTASDQCHNAGTCDPMTGACSNPVKTDGTSCSDGDACTQTDTCQSGVCSAGTPKTCTASDQCHNGGTCDPMTGACSNPAKSNGTSCSDGDACTQTDTCQSGVCSAGAPKTCTASDQCHDVGTCDPMTGACSNPTKSAGSPCSDDDACTLSDTCLAGTCTPGTPKTCAASDQCHNAGTCDPMTGSCSNPAKPNGDPCNDGNACTASDTCQTGTCTAGTATTCTASDQCHNAGTCDPQTGNCSNPAKNDGSPCSDGNGCTLTDTCQSGTCTAGAPVTCTALNGCRDAGTCDPQTGACSNPAVPDGLACDDGQISTIGDVCTNGTCAGGPLGKNCAEIRAAFPLSSLPDGIYRVRVLGVDKDVYCDMNSAGGGWEALFTGLNGSTNVFDAFDTGAYTGTFNNPSVQNYLQRAPADIFDTASEVAVQCGTAMVRFPATQALMRYLANGTRGNWITLSPVLVSGTVPNLPNSFWAGDASSGNGFIFARSNGGGANTFGSTFTGNSAYDYCNGQFDRTSTLRVYWRPAAVTPVHNTALTAGKSCRAIKLAGNSLGDGIYWIDPAGDGSALQKAYCDMTTDGGGWTALYSNRNGSVHRFDGWDSSTYAGICTDPASHCQKRAHSTVGDSNTDIAVSCGGNMVKFPMTTPMRRFLANGTRAPGWTSVSPTVIAGVVANQPNTFYTGDDANNQSFILARSQGGGGNTFASSYGNNTTFDYCAGVFDQASMVRLYYREAVPTAVRNTPQSARQSCLAVLLASESQGDGLYYLREGAGAPYLAYCDMTSAGGGWTAVFAGLNGFPNQFDAFEGPTYQGICTDPATHCVRRAPPSLNDASAELAVSCGTSMVRMSATEAARNWLVLGLSYPGGWIPVQASAVAGTIPNMPNTLYTGTPALPSFALSRSQGSGGNTFASNINFAGFDACNGQADASSPVRVYYRESTPAPVHNTVGTALESCRALRAAGFTQDGLYYLTFLVGPPQLRYCDMTSDGGGWTAIFSGRNGSPHVFDTFDTTTTQGLCPDPASRCLRFADGTARYRAGELAVTCGGAMVAAPITNKAWNLFGLGIRSDWASLRPRVVTGVVANVPDWLWTGATNSPSFIFARSQGGGGNTFASSYPTSNAYDFCVGQADQGAPIRVYYRENPPTAVRNTPASARVSCAAIVGANEAAGDGLYYLVEPAGAPYLAYCDMTTAGGGWTAFLSNRNGSEHFMGALEASSYAPNCTDPASRCLRRAPASASGANELAVSCGAAMVSFPLGAAASPIRNWMTSGIASSWQDIPGTVLTGSVANVPDSLWTGNGTDVSFIAARSRAAGGNTFASSYGTNSSWDFCAGVSDASSIIRVMYR